MKKILLSCLICFLSKPTFSQLTLSVSVTDASCPGVCNGSASVTATGGTPTYTYNWIPWGSSTYTNIAGLCPGTYSVQVSDAMGNTGTATYTISSVPSLTAAITQTNVSCYGSCDGRVTASISGGTSPYNLQWNPAGPNNLCPGTYSLQIIDSHGCYAVKGFTITQPPQLTATVSTTSVSCYGGSNGCATVSVNSGTGPYSYTWTPGGMQSATACNLSAGSYTVCAQEGSGCTVCKTLIITQPPPLLSSITNTNVNCNGACNGVLQANLNGGTPPYHYLWTPTSATTNIISNLCPGSYSLMATDNNSCTSSASGFIVQPPAVTYSLNSTAESCPGCCDGSISVSNLQGGCAPYWIVLNPGNISSGSGNFTNLCSMIYTVSIQDNCCPSVLSQTMCVDFNCGVATSIEETNNILFNSFSNELLIAKQACVSITDINGRIVLKIESTDENQTLDLSSLTNGVYIITSIQENKITSRKKILKYAD